MSTDDVHPSTDRLADLAADALDPAEAVSAQAHLGACADCRTTYEQLAGLSALLAGIAAPPVPVEVTARVVAAIEREQIARADAPGEARSAASARAARRSPSRAFRRGFGARVGAGLLGAAAVLGGGYVLATGVLGGGDDADPTSFGTADRLESGADEGGAGEEADAPAADSSSDTAYGAATLDQDVQQLLALSSPVVTSGRESGEPTTATTDGGEMDALAAIAPACVAASQRRADSDDDPLAVDIGTYDGVPAVVVVLPEPNGRPGPDAEVDVWVLGTTCLEADHAEMTGAPDRLDVLARRSVRP